MFNAEYFNIWLISGSNVLTIWIAKYYLKFQGGGKQIPSVKPSGSYFGDGLQQTEVDVDQTIKVFIREPEAFHVKLQLTTISEVRDLLRQNLVVQNQRVVLHKVLKHELLSWQTKKKKGRFS